MSALAVLLLMGLAPNGASLADASGSDAGAVDLAPPALSVVQTSPTSQASSASEEETPPSPGVPVTFRGKTLFRVYASSGKLDPAARASAIESRLLGAVSEPAAAREVRTLERAQSTDVLVGSTLIAALTDADAAPTGRAREQLALDVSAAVRSAIRREIEGRSLHGLALAARDAGFATLLLGLMLFVLRASYPRLRRRLASWRPGWIPTLSLGGFSLLSPARFAEALLVALRVVTFSAALVAIVAYSNAVLSFFPWTQGFAQRATTYVLHAIAGVVMAIVGYLPNLVYLALIFFFVRWILRILRLLANEVRKGSLTLSGFHPDWALPTYKIARFLVFALTAVVAFPYLPGSKSPAFQGVSIFIGVLLSFGSTSAISNIIAGVALTYMRPFVIGDRVQIADTIGDVIETSLLVVRIRTIKNVDVTIANSMVLGNHIVNYSACAKKEGLILHTSVTIGYDAPWRTVHELLIAAAGATDGVLGQPPPFVLQTALSDFYVSYQINAYTDRANQMAVISSELLAKIQDKFNAAGVEIMSQHYFGVRDGNAVTIPEAQRPPGYEAPAFRVELPVEPPKS